jgi:hypothetical protein
MRAAAAPGYVYNYPPPPAWISVPPSIYALPTRVQHTNTVVDDELISALRQIEQMESDERMARQLQEEDEAIVRKRRQEQTDAEFARHLLQQEEEERRVREEKTRQEQADAAFARLMQQEDEERQRQVEVDAAYAQRLAQGLPG